MATLTFNQTINAPKEKVWETLWNDSSYRQWTSAFMEGSYAESDWQQGSKILFLTPNGNGMYSIIETRIPFEQMSFRHLGEIKNGVEGPKNWEDATENYFLKEDNGVTELTVSMTAIPDFENYLNSTFPKALAILKQLAEQS